MLSVLMFGDTLRKVVRAGGYRKPRPTYSKLWLTKKIQRIEVQAITYIYSG